jgi:hypothetical protein
METGLAVTQEALERLDANVSRSVPKFRKRRSRERDLGEWWQPFVDEPLEPAQRCPFVARRIGVRQELAEEERVGEG